MASCARSSRPRRSAVAGPAPALCACARRRQRGAPRPPRAHAHSQSRAGWFPCCLRYPGGTHKLLPTHTAGWGSYGDAYPGDTGTRTVTRAILTHVLSHTAQTPRAARSHPRSPAGTTWKNVKGWSSPGAISVTMMHARIFISNSLPDKT